MRIKNKEIAERLGISQTAVSFAVNGKPGVSDETRRKVLELLSEEAQQSAASVEEVPGRKGDIVFCVHHGSGTIIDDKPFFRILIERSQAAVSAHGYNLLIMNYREGDDLDAYLGELSATKPRGIILEATELDANALRKYKALDIPLVLLDGYLDLDDTDAVALNDAEIALSCVNYLVSRGHRDIGYLQGVPDINNFLHRRDGFWKGLIENGIEGRNHPFIPLPCSVGEAYEGMRSFLADPPEGFQMPTAFYCDLDYIAIGAMKALQEAGFDVPGDVSVVGSDDIGTAAFTNPPLTTVRVNQEDLGRLAGEAIIRRIEGPGSARTLTLVSSEFVERESVADAS